MASPILFDGGRALIRCKHCRGVVHAIHRKRHLEQCRHYQRRQKLGRMAFEKNGRKLYAIAVLRFNPATKDYHNEMHYTHGFDAAEARRIYLYGEKDRAHVHIVETGLAIGMFAADRDGKILVSD